MKIVRAEALHCDGGGRPGTLPRPHTANTLPGGGGGYVQSHVRPGAYASGRTPRYDGVAITWFDDTQAMRASAATAEYATTRADEANVLTSGDAPGIITREHVIVT